MKRKYRNTVLVLGIMTLLAMFCSQVAAQALVEGRELVIRERFKRIVVVNFGDNVEVNDRLLKQVEQQIEDAEQYERTALVFEITSGGGRTDAAAAIASLIQSYRESDRLRIFAFVPRQALSAAAWMAFSCKGLFIALNATIGDIQPLVMDWKGFDRAPEKIVTQLTEQIRISCQNNGLAVRYPRLFLEAMVDKDIEIVAVENRRLGVTDYMREEDWSAMPDDRKDGLTPNFIGLPGKALTTNGRELLDYGFTVKILDETPETLLNILGETDATYEYRQLRSSQGLGWVRFDASFLLLILGIVLLVMEFKTPGLGLFGVGGIATLVAFFLVRAGFGEAAIWPIGLFVVGVFLVIVEFVLFPGLIVPGLAGVALVLFATWKAVANPGEPGLPPFPDLGNPEDSAAVRLWASTLVGGLGGGLTFTIVLGKFLHNIPFLNKLVLVAPRGGDLPEPATASTTRELIAVGAEGETITELRPSGAAVFAGRRLNVMTQGRFVEAGTPVRVTSVSGNRIVVKQIKADTTS